MSIGLKFNLSVLSTSLIILFGSYFALHFIHEKNKAKKYIEIKNSLVIDLEHHTFAQSHVGLASAVSLINNDNIIESLKTNNRQLAIDSLENIIQSYKKVITEHNMNIHIHTKDIKSFVRLWNLEKYGDDLTSFRNSIVKVKKYKEAISTYEIGKKGLSLRSIVPILDKEGRYLGSLELIQASNETAVKFKDNGNGYLLLMDKDKAKITLFDKAKTFQSHYIVAQKSYNKHFMKDAKTIELDKLFKDGYYIDNKYFYTYRNIKDIDSNTIGIALIGTPISKVNTLIESSVELINFILLMMTILIVVLLIALTIVVRKFVILPLHLLNKSLDSFFKYLKDPTNRLEYIKIEGNDEFSIISKNINNGIKISSKMHYELSNLMQIMDNHIITSETNKNGIITYVSKAFCEISGYSKEELIGKPHNIIRHPDTAKEVFKEMWNTLHKNQIWKGEVKNLKKDGSYYWVYAIITPKHIENEKSLGYTAIRQDITAKKEVEDLTKNLEKKIVERTKELDDEKGFISSVMDAQNNIIVTSDFTSLRTVNKAFLDFYEVRDKNEFVEKFGNCICNTFDTKSSQEYIQKKVDGNVWSHYILDRPDEIHKAIIYKDEKPYVFTITIDEFIFDNEKFYTVVFTDITELERIRQEIEAIHKQTKDSIEYAAFIQRALIPTSEQFDEYFKDSFVIWQPKDIVGGDIYLFNTFEHSDESILMCIDCTGHGVPGAFVTMLVKAIESQMRAYILQTNLCDISPTWVLSYFNTYIKILLKQETKDSVSNAGFDGAIICYNKKTKVMKYAGANIPLHYIDENQKYQIIKPQRYSVGYATCDMLHTYTEHQLDVKNGMKFYLTTDGFIDQKGGEKGFSFGKTRFKNIIEKNYKKSMSQQSEILNDTLINYQDDYFRIDDITVIGIEIQGDETLFCFNGVVTYDVVSNLGLSMKNELLKELSPKIVSKIYDIFIEMLQNIMNYSAEKDSITNKGIGSCTIIKENDNFIISARNLLKTQDTDIIKHKIDIINSYKIDELSSYYKEVRKHGKDSHEDGAGLGLITIARKSQNKIKYDISNIDDEFSLLDITVRL